MTEYEFDSAADLDDGLVEALAFCLQGALARGTTASLAMTPDSGLVTACTRLSGRALAWSRVAIYFSDAVWVAAGSAEDEGHRLRRALASGAAVAAPIHDLRALGDTPLAAIPTLVEQVQRWPRPFDVAVVAVRGDGGFAGLHPDMPALAAMLDPRWSLPLGVSRTTQGDGVTLSLRSLLQVRDLFVVARSAEAGTAMDAALRDPARASTPVAALLRHAPHTVRVLRVVVPS